METPASLYALRVPSKKVMRRLNGTEMALAALVYSHARADHAVPVCTRPIALVARMLGYTRGNIQEASRVLEAAGYWRRVRVGSVWRWEILILPSSDGHRWADHVPQDPPNEVPPDQGEVPQSGDHPIGSPVPQSGGTPIRGPVPQSGAPQSGVVYPNRGVARYPNRGTQHQQLIREEEASALPRDPRIALADAINAQTERFEAAARASPRAPMNPGSAIAPEHQAIRERFQAVVGSWPVGSPERTRLAACRVATPLPHVIASAVESLGDLDQVLAVLEWAWRAVATGRLTKIGATDAPKAITEAFRGEGRYFGGLVEAYGRRPGEQRAIAWQRPDLPDVPDAEIAKFDSMLEALRQ